MRSTKKDIAELYGYAPDNQSETCLAFFNSEKCPFSGLTCIKKLENRGVCAVSAATTPDPKNDVIICPERMYANNYQTIKDIAQTVWKEKYSEENFLIGKSLDEMKRQISTKENAILAFGKHSGQEIKIGSELSMDWIIQRYEASNGIKKPIEFIGIEVQTIDTTNNYTETLESYRKIKNGNPVTSIKPSSHGLNWSNVHKRLIPQIIRKGNVYSQIENCMGFFFLIPDIVFEKFENVLTDLRATNTYGRDTLSVITYSLDENDTSSIRLLKKKRTIHYKLSEIIYAFSNYKPTDEKITQFKKKLANIIK
jgi:hypothetical protein